MWLEEESQRANEILSVGGGGGVLSGMEQLEPRRQLKPGAETRPSKSRRARSKKKL